jgi:DNA-binding NtrC family response regulator
MHSDLIYMPDQPPIANRQRTQGQHDGRWPKASGPLPRELRDSVFRASKASVPLLIEGETGVGKTYLARWIHNLGPRCGKPFVNVNCTNLAGHLLEAELFGHERGAYTDAKATRVGLVEMASGGTLFLDEIAELPQADQARVLTVVEERFVRRIGGNRTIPTDLRIICATNRDVAELLSSGGLRSDLFYRISALRLRIPPLRDRRDEIPDLITHIIHEIPSSTIGLELTDDRQIDSAAVALLSSLDWPGNIRELRTVVQRALLESEGQPIRVEHANAALADLVRLPLAAATDAPGLLQSRHRYKPPADPETERRQIITALREYRNKSRAAQALDMSRQTLYNRILRYRITESEWISSRSSSSEPR